MRVMVFAKATEVSENSAPPTAEAFAAMDLFTEELVKAGVFIAAAGLKNSAQAKRVVLDGPSRTVIDGPLAETRELVVGPQCHAGQERDGDPAVLRGGGSGRVHDARGAKGAP